MEIKRSLYVVCAKCKGKKLIEGKECDRCNGTGHVLKLYTGKFSRRKTLL